eukprot:m.44434 g.44434  ORF g.44434 m.44434 type:complete len:62 (-) comp13012_c0_seq2:100-285(-)
MLCIFLKGNLFLNIHSSCLRCHAEKVGSYSFSEDQPAKLKQMFCRRSAKSSLQTQQQELWL